VLYHILQGSGRLEIGRDLTGTILLYHNILQGSAGLELVNETWQG
jgi:hypothetical protein